MYFGAEEGSVMDRLRGQQQGGQGESTSMISGGSECFGFSLTYEQRLWGFGICFVLGWVFSFMSLVFLPKIVSHPEKFAVSYTFGAIISILSTGFLWGPVKQCKTMFKKQRAPATIIYFFFMIMTLVSAFKFKNAGAVIVCLLCQFLAMLYYTLTYIPYGQRMLKSCLTGCFD